MALVSFLPFLELAGEATTTTTATDDDDTTSDEVATTTATDGDEATTTATSDEKRKVSKVSIRWLRAQGTGPPPPEEGEMVFFQREVRNDSDTTSDEVATTATRDESADNKDPQLDTRGCPLQERGRSCTVLSLLQPTLTQPTQPINNNI